MLKKYILEKIILNKLINIYNLIYLENHFKIDLDKNISSIYTNLIDKKISINMFNIFISDNSLLSNINGFQSFLIDLSYYDKQNKYIKLIYLSHNHLDKLNENLKIVLNGEINFKEISILNLIKLNKYLKLFQLELENKINNDKKELLNYFGF